MFSAVSENTVLLNRAELRDKIHACWTGKNIGGTIGTPYEGTREALDISGFHSRKGEPLANDDLDLQLVWLTALERVGPWSLKAADLGEYWLALIPPSWNEYGIGKTNMLTGFPPPISGEVANEGWKHSNGAWIRSELWACLAPGYSGIARRYAMEDAMVDHGMGEGTFAELFTATLESEAFFCRDVRELIRRALAQVPQDSMLAKSVRLVEECYDAGVDYRETRERVLELNKELGWFQAPGNVAFAVIGLLYGEGDFKKSVICAVNCGDDTDCTGGTVGAVLGIMHGMAGIPQDWAEYIGDRIITKSLNLGYHYYFPETCEELTDRVMQMIPAVFSANFLYMEYTDGEDRVHERREGYGPTLAALTDRAPYSFDLSGTAILGGRVTYAKEPLLAPSETLDVVIDLDSHRAQGTENRKTFSPYGPYWVTMEVLAPEGWAADYTHRAFIQHTDRVAMGGQLRLTLTAPEKLPATSTVVLLIRAEGTMQTVAVPLVIGTK